MPINYKKKFAYLNSISNSSPTWYVNFDKKTGDIYSIKNHKNDSDSFFAISHEEAIEFNSRNKIIENYSVVWDKQQKSYKLQKKADMTIETIKNMIMEVLPNIEETDVVILKDYKNKEWKITVANDTPEKYNNGEVIASDFLHFSVTEKQNPHILYRTLIINISELFQSPVILPFDDYDDKHLLYSVYTNKKLDSYTIKEACL